MSVYSSPRVWAAKGRKVAPVSDIRFGLRAVSG